MIGMWTFGMATRLRYMQDVSITGGKGEDLCLAYKMSILHIFFPICTIRDGHVLGILQKKAGTKRVLSTKTFYPLTAAEIAKWQASGGLPTPLPPYKMTFGDIAAGYWVLMLLAAVAVCGPVAFGLVRLLD